MKNPIKNRLGHEIKRGAGAHTDKSKEIDDDAAIEEGLSEAESQYIELLAKKAPDYRLEALLNLNQEKEDERK